MNNFTLLYWLFLLIRSSELTNGLSCSKDFCVFYEYTFNYASTDWAMQLIEKASND